jgi:hypothetical protein
VDEPDHHAHANDHQDGRKDQSVVVAHEAAADDSGGGYHGTDGDIDSAYQDHQGLTKGNDH